MNEQRPRYNKEAVALIVDIDDHIAQLAPPQDQRVRRARMIRAAIEGQIEYETPRVQRDVLDLLAKALIAQVSTIDDDTEWLSSRLKRIESYVLGRSPLS